jgi:hypothetical protein
MGVWLELGWILTYIDNVLDPQAIGMPGTTVENTNPFSDANPYDGMAAIANDSELVYFPIPDNVPTSVDAANNPDCFPMIMTAGPSLYDSNAATFVHLETSPSQGSDISSTSYDSIICMTNNANLANSWTSPNFERTPTMEIDSNNPVGAASNATSYPFDSANSAQWCYPLSPSSNWFVSQDSLSLILRNSYERMDIL